MTLPAIVLAWATLLLMFYRFTFALEVPPDWQVGIKSAWHAWSIWAAWSLFMWLALHLRSPSRC